MNKLNSIENRLKKATTKDKILVVWQDLDDGQLKHDSGAPYIPDDVPDGTTVIKVTYEKDWKHAQENA